MPKDPMLGVIRTYVNHGYFTMSLCECDRMFMHCLNQVGLGGQLLYNFYREVLMAECLTVYRYVIYRDIMPGPIRYQQDYKGKTSTLYENTTIAA